MMPDMMETASQLGARVAAAQARADGLSRTAATKLDEARHETAGALRSAASSVRATAGGSADKLDATASYVETHDGRGLLGGCRQWIRRNPAGAFVVAAGIGFFAASAIRHLLGFVEKD